MAEGPPGGGEKTEAPTPKRLQESAKKGDVLQSKELGGAMVVIAAALGFAALGSSLMDAIAEMLSSGLSIERADIENFNPSEQTYRHVSKILLPFLGLFGLTMLAAIATPILLGSLGFRWSAMKPKGDKLNPLNGLKRMFGTRGLIELGKSLAKVILLGCIGLWLVYANLPYMFALGAQDTRGAVGQFGDLFVIIMMVMAAGFFIIAGIDLPAQMFQRGKRLRMTKQEVKDEHKDIEGAPEVKWEQRKRQQATLSQSTRKAVEEATVVLNNPVHFSVVLRYRPGIDAVPVMLAKGRGEMATAIRELAEERGVPMLQFPMLTRAVYFTTPVGGVIDERLYVAVATVLAFLFRLDAQISDGLERPHVDLPDELRFDSDGNTEN
ncbi:EscU/YscU/HrcU family type III secretion system export apparatus switch protein [Parasphingorhabdus cellanae]|uniref:Flagellar biosynthesis protein FlhB n=1 Tax=Parasphingorhabdus cellanae TaxID=2806553 RepID=A0ABX7T5Q8_9SPHN|nr:flagellar type III secretion system protein FlhB [Parasphingorhabdus cellanae]QTD56471.1 flagellar biosynthesis protein FlhB [Parasphingorhabdus cellanae]